MSDQENKEREDAKPGDTAQAAVPEVPAGASVSGEIILPADDPEEDHEQRAARAAPAGALLGRRHVAG